MRGIFYKALATIAFAGTTVAVNTSCPIFSYQPKMHKDCDRLKRF